MQVHTTARRIPLSSANLRPIPQRPSSIALSTSDFIEVTPLSEILFIQAAGNYCTFFLKNGRKIMVSKTIKHYDDALQASTFVRPHQSYLVNLQHIQRVRKVPYCAICMINDAEIPVARSRRTAFMAALTTAAFL